MPPCSPLQTNTGPGKADFLKVSGPLKIPPWRLPSRTSPKQVRRARTALKSNECQVLQQPHSYSSSSQFGAVDFLISQPRPPPWPMQSISSAVCPQGGITQRPRRAVARVRPSALRPPPAAPCHGGLRAGPHGRATERSNDGELIEPAGVAQAGHLDRRPEPCRGPPRPRRTRPWCAPEPRPWCAPEPRPWCARPSPVRLADG